MNKIVVAILTVIVALCLAHSAEARGRVGFYFSSGSNCCSGPYWGPHAYPYPPYYPHYHRRPVIVTPPPVVVYEQPPVTYTVPIPAQNSIPANQTSETFTDGQGRTCRSYETTQIVDGIAQNIQGTACLSRDGTWRVVN